jgi:RHS repeat-associated protein
MTDATGATTYTYDNRGRLKNRATPEGTLTYSYDKTGNMLSARSSNTHGLSVDYAYDLANRLASLTDNNLAALTGTTAYTYDDAGNALNCQYGNGLKSSYTYNALNRLTDVRTGTPTSTIASYAYVLGNAGNRLSMTEQGGRAVAYGYDDLYRLTDETISGEPNNGNNGNLHYGYDNVGNRLNRTSSVAVLSSVTSTFDKNDRLASDSYDANGNTSAAMGASFSYDFEDHLADVNQGGITYLYDGDGNRVAKKVAGTTIKYLVDTNNPTGHPQVAEEHVGGSVRRAYTYGRSLVSQNQLINNQWAVSFYGKDGHGNVRYLTDSNGAVTDRYDYDAFGNLIKQSGSTPNDYLFASEQYDAHLGMTYLRARYLNAQTGRFLTIDPYMGDKGQPQSLHRYSYVANDPVNKLDPTGKMLEEELEAISIESELDAGSTQLMLPFEDVAIDAASEAEAAGEEIANEFVVEDQLEAARTLGKAGEDAAGIVKNTERIESLTNTSNYRIPDELDRAAKVLGEVKNVARLGRTRQLLDFALYARQEGYAFRLFVRAAGGTRFSGPLQELIEEYGIEVIRNLP